MTMPGWYPDPQDPSWLQYFDGQRWTGDRQPTSDVIPAVHVEPGVSELTVPRHASPDVAPFSPGIHPPSYPTGIEAPAYPAAPQQVAYQPVAAHVPAMHEYAPLPPAWAPPQAPEWTPTPRRRRRRVRLVLGLCLVLAAGLVTGGWFLAHRSDSAAFTFAGQTVHEPDSTLGKAEQAVNAIVAQRHGAKNSTTRCYFELPASPPKGARKTDIGSAVQCGPVLFVDGDARKAYLTFPLSSSPDEHGAVDLSPASEPVSGDPSAPPPDVVLSRPDGQTAPPDGGLQVPPPPPAETSTLVTASVTEPSLPAAPHDAVMASLRGGVRVTKVGVVERYGSGDEARSAPPGERLIAFSYVQVAGQIGNVSPTSRQFGLSVNHGAVQPLPHVADGQVNVVAVPAGGADLVLNQDGIRQTIALPSGKPGPANLAVLRRDHIDAMLKINKPLTIKFTINGTSADLSGRVTATHALIGYWTDDGKHHASSGSKALLWMDFRFKIPKQGDQTGIDAPLLRLTPAGGKPIPAKDLAPGDTVFTVFEVPATFTVGTITISGSEPGKTAIRVVTPVKFTVTIPR
ncbi:MAG TPA: DUF2510 domain-containing protein [Jatrophihabitantaceae bacterium]